MNDKNFKETSKQSVKSVQIRSFFWSVFSRIRTEYEPEKTPYLDTFHAVKFTSDVTIIWTSFTSFSSFYIVDFEQTIICRATLKFGIRSINLKIDREWPYISISKKQSNQARNCCKCFGDMSIFLKLVAVFTVLLSYLQIMTIFHF